jgi:hypothetical protein
MEPLEPFSNGLAVVALNGRWFYIDKAGKYVKDYR